MIFFERLRWLRQKHNYTQAQMAELIGMSTPGYTKVEQGQRELKFEKLIMLPGILGESLDFIFGITNLDRQATIYWTECVKEYAAYEIQYSAFSNLLVDQSIRESLGDEKYAEHIHNADIQVLNRLTKAQYQRAQLIDYCKGIPGFDLSEIDKQFPFPDYKKRHL